MNFRSSARKQQPHHHSNGRAPSASSASSSSAVERAEEARKISQSRGKTGSITIKGLVLGILPHKPSGGGQKQTAIAGQAGAGGAQPKDPPMQFQVIPFGIADLTGGAKETPDYVVINAETIEMPLRNHGRMGKAFKALKDAKGIDPSGALTKELEDSQEIVQQHQISCTSTLLVKCFDLNAVRMVKPMETVHLVGFLPEASWYNGELRINYSCAKPERCKSTGSVLEDVFKFLDINYNPVRLSTLNPYDSLILAFNNFQADDATYFAERHLAWEALPEAERKKQEEPIMFRRGPVLSKEMANPTDPDAWLIKTKDAPDRHKLEYACEIVQNDYRPGYPEGRYMVMAVALDGDFSDEGQKKKTIRAAIGINDTAKYAAIMSTNSIPALIVCSVNHKDMGTCNGGIEYDRPVPADRTAIIKCWANHVTLMLREYLCLFCPRVSEDWVRTRFRIKKAPADFNINMFDAKRPCFLNMESTTKDRDRKTIFCGPNVVLLDEWQGLVSDLIDDGGELRVLHSAPLTDDQREWLAAQPENVVESILRRSDAAINDYPDLAEAFSNVVTFVYCVKRVDLTVMEERRKEIDAHWRTKALERHKADLARAKEQQEREEAAMIAAAEAAEQKVRVPAPPSPKEGSLVHDIKKRIREAGGNPEDATLVDAMVKEAELAEPDAEVVEEMYAQVPMDESPDQPPATFYPVDPEEQDDVPIPVKPEPAKPKKRKVKRTVKQSPGRASPTAHEK